MGMAACTSVHGLGFRVSMNLQHCDLPCSHYELRSPVGWFKDPIAVLRTLLETTNPQTLSTEASLGPNPSKKQSLELNLKTYSPKPSTAQVKKNKPYNKPKSPDLES